MYHYGFVSLDEGKNSVAYYARAVPRSLIVFIHGFTGKSIETWTDFTPLMLNDSDFAETDLLFYGYDSTKGHAFDQASEFYRFLQVYNKRDKRKVLSNTEAIYDRIIIVAHSLGSIVTRYALISAIEDGCVWVKKCSMTLFAPAHNGAKPQMLIAEAKMTLLNIIMMMVYHTKPVVMDLKAGSDCIERLKIETERYRGTVYEKILSAKTVHALNDKVVVNGKYCYDSMLKESPINGYTHSKVCKPKGPSYLVPIEIIKHALK